MRKSIITAIAIAIAFALTACHTTKSTTQVVTQTAHDTLYLNKLQYDSIFITQEHFVDRSSDTVRIRDVCIQYKYKLLQDTVYKSKVDSIPVIKEVEVTKEIERPLTWFDKLCRYCFWALLIIFVLDIVRVVIKYYPSAISWIQSINHKL